MMKWRSIAWLFSTCMTSLSFRVTAISMKIKNKKPLKSSVISLFLFLAGLFPSPPSSSRMRDLAVKEKKMELIVIWNFLPNLLTKLLLPNNTLTSICLWELLKWRTMRIDVGEETEGLKPLFYSTKLCLSTVSLQWSLLDQLNDTEKNV